jgi:two-component system, LytTR family, response regulator
LTAIRALLVDDEPLARLRLRRLLEAAGNVEMLECANGAEALKACRQRWPDVMFLDVEMPMMDGFSVLYDLDATTTPIVVFVTAYDRYAVRAFEECALDYLLKPFDDLRFAKTMARIRQRLANRPSGRSRPSFFAVLQKRGTRIVPASDVDWIGAAGNYVELHAGPEVFLHRESLRAIETRMPGTMVRVHRGALVNPKKVRALQWTGHGDGIAVLAEGCTIRVSRRYSRALKCLFSPVRVRSNPG